MPSPQPNKPGRLWYGWQYARAFTKTFKHRPTKMDAQKMLRNAGIAAGSLAAGSLLAKFLYIPLIVPFATSLAAVVTAGYCGFKAYKNFKVIKDSTVVYNHIREHERLWAEKKSRPGAFRRLGAIFKRSSEKKSPPPVAEEKVFPAPKNSGVEESPATERKTVLSEARRKAAAYRRAGRPGRGGPGAF